MNPDSANLSEAKRSLLQKYLRGEISQKIAGPSIIPRRPPRTPVPLSLAQQQVWLHSQLISPETPVYNEPMTLWRKGPLNVEALERSLAEIIRRHESWRTTIGMTDGKPVQVIHPAVSSYKVPYVDLRSLPDGQREAEAVRIATAEARKPFDVQQGPLVRATLVTVNDSDHRLYMTLHQIIMDGVSSYRVFLPEIISIYEAYSQGKSSPLPELPIQFGDFAVWQRDWVREDRIAKQMDYWRTQLTGNSAGVFTDHTRPTIQTHRGAMHPLHLGGELTRGLRRFSQQEGATLFMTLLAGFAGVLGRYSGLDEIVLGTPTASRKRPELESLLGYFVNPVALRISLAGDPTFRDLLGRVKDTVSEALFNDEVPFAYLVEQLRPAPDPSRNPFFQIAISLEPPPTAGEPEWSLSLADVSTGATKLDMYLLMDEKLEGITGPFTYNADLYEPETIARIVGHWQTLLEDALEHPDRRLSDLKLLTPAEERQILVEWNETHVSFPESNSISQLFEAQAARTPKSAAVIDGKSRLTFSELNERANQLAHYLNSKGVGPETLVSLCLERSASAIVGLLGILKAGGAYVPLDPAYPRERLQFMLDDSGATFLLTDSRMMGRIGKGAATTIQLDADSKAIEKESKENPPGSVSAENLAYVIYTSGSTGQPKGVQATHGASLNRFHWMWSKFPFQQDDVCCQKTSLSFVDSVWELFGPLLQGVPTVILSDEQVKDPRAFTEALAQNRVTRIVLVPSLLRLLLDAFSNLGTRLPDLKLCVSSGEALPADLARRFQKSAPQCKLVNLYGSSEVAADASCFECSCVPSLPTVPIGRPITNSQIYILDRNQKAVPIGVPGELYVGGAGLARGYLNRPELTAEKFVANPFVNTGTARLYKTGDLARFRSDGNIEHLGRLDSQVKVRGHRIELGEVEATLAQCPDVSACAVAARDDKQGDTQLVAYAVVSGKPMTAGEIRRYLRQRLPDTMVPSHIVFVEALPLLPNGKVDRRALPAPEPSADVRQDLFVAPRNTVESKLVAIWEDVLDIPGVGVRQNFFSLGGNSLQVARLLLQVEEMFKTRLTMPMLLGAPTVEQLASIVSGQGPSISWPEQIIPIQGEGTRRPFFCVGGSPLFWPLAQQLGHDQPFLGLVDLPQQQALLLPFPYQLEDIARGLVRVIRAQQTEGPYCIGGWCLEGVLAYETARQLRENENQDVLLILIDTPNPAYYLRIWNANRVTLAARKMRYHVSNLTKLKMADVFAYGVRLANEVKRKARNFGWETSSQIRRHLKKGPQQEPDEIVYLAAMSYQALPFPGRVVFFQSEERPPGEPWNFPLGWRNFVTGKFEVREIKGDHLSILREPDVQTLARLMTSIMEESR